MRGLRTMLFGIALMLGAGLTLIHIYQIGNTWDYRGTIDTARLGILVGFLVVTAGFLYGTVFDWVDSESMPLRNQNDRK